MNYSYTIEYVATAKFANADGLSRFVRGSDENFDKEMASGVFTISCDSQHVFALHTQSLYKLPVKEKDIATETASYPVLSRVQQYMSQGWPEKGRTPTSHQSIDRDWN